MISKAEKKILRRCDSSVRFCSISAGAFEVISLVVAAASTAEQINKQQQAAEAQRNLIRQRQTQEGLAAAQRTARRIKRFNAVVSAQRATAASHGVSLSSPSFQGIQLTSFKNFREDTKNAALNESFQNNALNTEANGISARAAAGEWGAGLNFMGGAFQQVDINKLTGSTEKEPNVSTRYDTNNIKLPKPFSDPFDQEG